MHIECEILSFAHTSGVRCENIEGGKEEDAICQA
jgi:hypothetical protein